MISSLSVIWVLAALAQAGCGGGSASHGQDSGYDSGTAVDALPQDAAPGPDADAHGDAGALDAAVNQPVGAPCLDAADCAGNWCITEDYGWPGGYCTHYACDLGSPATSCAPYGGDGICLEVGEEGATYGLCFDRCAPALGDASCRLGYQCRSLWDGTSAGICVPAPICGNGVVEWGEECEPPGVGNCDEYCVGVGAAPVGDPCASAADCAGNWCVAEAQGWIGGYCSHFDCDPDVPLGSCASAGGDGFCLEVGPVTQPYGMCFDLCDPGAGDAECRAEYECVALLDGTGRGLCFPEPVCGNGVVERGEECEPPGVGNCDVDCQGLGDAPVGDPCASATDCAGNWCLVAADGWPGGYCTHYECDLDLPVTSCGPAGGDGYCVDVGWAGEPFGMCFDGCDPQEGNTECRVGYECVDRWDSSGLGLCFPEPVCGNGVVERGEECEPPGVGNCDADCQGLGTDPVGAPCATAADCDGNWCLGEADGWPGGYCTHYGCDTSAPLTACVSVAGDGRCINVGTAEQPLGLCLDGCFPGPNPCRVGYSCQLGGVAMWVCVPE